ncbi:MAG: FHA domain-containing protein [Woeseia sp.]
MLPKQAKPGAEPATIPTLKLTRNGVTVQEFSLDRPNLMIGRAADNDISIPSPYVSWHHILIIRCGGLSILIDLNSTNGTFVNCLPVHRYVLEDADVISLDRHSLFVKYGIEFSDPAMTADNIEVDAEAVDPVIQKALAQFENLLVGGDTDLLPRLSEHVPTVVGYVDDR